jgi:hypothetical protein
MLRRLFIVAVVGLFLMPVVAQAQFNQGDLELTLAATGSSHRSVTDNGLFGTTRVDGEGSLGYFITKEMEVAYRQVLGYRHPGVGSAQDWPAFTGAAFDFHFDLDRFQPFVGGTVGFRSGQQPEIQDTFAGGPEVGVKWFANSTTFLFGRVVYELSFQDASEAQLLYTAGVGFKF